MTKLLLHLAALTSIQTSLNSAFVSRFSVNSNQFLTITASCFVRQLHRDNIGPKCTTTLLCNDFTRCIRRRTVGPLSARSDDDQNDSIEIFYDDFGNVTVGGLGSFDPSSSSLPDFDDSSSTMLSTSDDRTGATFRQFSLGSDLLISTYVGSMGYDRVTDWRYYFRDVDEDGNFFDERTTMITPVPFVMDPSRPSRTRSSSGSMVRLFRGEFVGKLGSSLQAAGMDVRVMLREYYSPDNDDVASLELIHGEKGGLVQVMSGWLEDVLQKKNNKSNDEVLEGLQSGQWEREARRRYVDKITNAPTPADDANVATLLSLLHKKKAPFAALLGEMNLNDYYDDPNLNPNEWYKSLGVKPPTPGSTWLVYDYHGLSTASSYSVPLIVRQSNLPPKRGVFGNIVRPEPLPPFRERARYVREILGQMLRAVAVAHDAGVVHKSIGGNSFILSSVGQDKGEASGPYAVCVERLRVVLSDWGFSQSIPDAVKDEEFVRRARSLFNVDVECFDGELAVELAKAEDLHALGFVFLGLLFGTLAEPATASAPMPPTDDDTWQRLFSDIFEKDMMAFREYCADEEVWSSVVELLDGEEGAGWNLLGGLLLAREGVVELSRNGKRREEELLLPSARSLLSSPFFGMRIM